MRLQPKEEYPHGLTDWEFDALFTTNKPIIFAYPRISLADTPPRIPPDKPQESPCAGYKEEGTTSTPFDMVVRNDLDRFHLVEDVIDRVPKLGSIAAYAKQAVENKLVEHKEYIAKYGIDMPEITEWTWDGNKKRKVGVKKANEYALISRRTGIRIWIPHQSMNENLRQQARNIFNAALRAVDPEEAILNHIKEERALN